MKPGPSPGFFVRKLMRRWLVILLAVTACSDARQEPRFAPVVIGKLEDADIREASGIARSQRQENILWLINDNGAKEIVHAINPRGARRGEFDLKEAKNRDWEDLASFRLDDTPYLMVADIGDNDARRKSRSLYFVEEPAPKKKDKASLAWRIEFEYPDGPRDAESAAVDIENLRALVLSKRDIPPRLYEIPLRPGDDGTITATRLGTIRSLPKPSRQDVEFAPKTRDWHWQPVGMDISQDNRAAVILTYRAVYYYQREPGQDWYDAFNTRPIRVSIGRFPNAEAVAFGDDGRNVVVTGENKHSPLLLIDFNEVAEE